jgi:hypothetical protein
MASKKISWRMANSIANRIADKAFEHLINPKQKMLEAVGAEAFDVLKQHIDLDLLRRFNIVGSDSNMRLKVKCAADGSDDSTVLIQFKAEDGFTPYNPQTPTVTDDGLWQRARDLSGELNVLRHKRYALYNELKSQLEGKTTNMAIKAWPEAAEIIAQIANVTLVGDMTTPLESLLSKYLPMLAAPQGV